MVNKIGFGVIGAGLWGESHAHVFASHPYAELVGVYDINKAKAKELSEQYGAKCYDSLELMLEDEKVEAVGIATPDFAHRDVAVKAANAGKHILLEKPLATTLEDTDAIADAVKKNNVRLMVDFHARWNPPFVIAKNKIVEGELGDIVSGYYRLNDVISVPMGMLSWAEKSSILWFLGSHAVDTLRWLFNDEVEKVYSVSREGVLKGKGINVPDIYQTILEFRSGIIATIENNWIVPNTQPNVNDMKLNVLGSKGMIDMDLTNHGLISVFTEDKLTQPDTLVNPFIHGKRQGFAIEAIRDFVERLAKDEAFVTDLDDGINVTKTILAIMKSAKSGKPELVEY